jgi:hypothetical protein
VAALCHPILVWVRETGDRDRIGHERAKADKMWYMYISRVKKTITFS